MAKKSEALVLWEQTMMEEAKEAASIEASHVGGIQSIQFSSAGKMSFNDEPIPGDEVAVVIVGSTFHNRYYKEKYDPRTEEKIPPVCWASARVEDDMKPSPKAPDPQNEDCLSCPWNQWNSADVGRGKACQNRRLLTVVDAGEFEKNGDLAMHDPSEVDGGDLLRINLPATAIKNWAKYVKKLNTDYKRPPFGVVTRIATEPLDGSGYEVIFEDLAVVSEEYAEAVMGRVEAAKDVPTPEYEYSDNGDDKATKKKGGTKKSSSKKATGTRRKAAPKRKASSTKKKTTSKRTVSKKSGTRRGGKY